MAKSSATLAPAESPTSWSLADIMKAYQKVRHAEWRVDNAKNELKTARQDLKEARDTLDEMMQQLMAETAKQA